VDYPGEWLLDLGLLDKTLRGLVGRDAPPDRAARERRGLPRGAGRRRPRREARRARREGARAAFTGYLTAARKAGFSDCTPGRFLLPGDLAGSPVLTFAPLPKPASVPRGSVWREFERRFESYKREVVKPFFRDHFARIDRQVVLVDALGAIHAGPRAVDDLRLAMTDILSAFRPAGTRS
jgi:uncharacterized protein